MQRFFKLVLILLFFSLADLFAQSADTTQAVKAAKPNPYNIYPVFMYAPETSLGLGVTTFRLFHIGDESRTSNVSATAIYTLKNQLLIESGTTLFFDHEKWLVKGRLNGRRFPENFYGIGEKATADNKVVTDYSYYNIQSAVYRRIFKGAFLGLQGTYNDYFNISFKGTAPTGLTGESGSRNVGLGASFLYDTRDNVLNATKGVYTELSALIFSDKLGTQYNYNAYVADLRKYHSISKKSVVAFQLLGLIKTGDVPFLQLSYLGGSDIMRGFYSGRYRDKTLAASQVEYRRQIRDHIGVVAFAGVGNVTDDPKNFDFRNLKSSLGMGLRLMLDDKERVNLRIDGGWGNGQFNLYIALAEAF